jgi:hypothetical protein
LSDNEIEIMIAFPAKARTDSEGTLSLTIPIGVPNAEVNVVVVVDASLSNGDAPSDAWPDGYFQRHFGSLRDSGLERPPQGELPDRLHLE